MRIAVSAQSPNLESDVDPRFGRAPHFVIFDVDADEFEAVDNSNASEAKQGAGVQAAQTVVGHKVDAVLTGHCGPKAHQLLATSGVKIYVGVEGNIRDAIGRCRRGEMCPCEAPDVEGRWS
jgi:predicted Fe-Mo cluster-binding NifX family protein